ncbi:MAG: S9 family peptidase [Planctomycetota bacterium]
MKKLLYRNLLMLAMLFALLPLSWAQEEGMSDELLVRLDSWLQAGPFPVPTPAFEVSEDSASAENLLDATHLDLKELWPAEGETLPWHGGKIGAWAVKEAEGGRIEIAPQASPAEALEMTFLAGYLETFQRLEAEIKISASAPFVLFVDGEEEKRQDEPASGKEEPKELKVKLDLVKGKHRLLIKTLSVTDDEQTPWFIRAELTASLGDKDPDPPKWSLSPVRFFTDFEEINSLTSISQVAYSPAGTYLAVQLSIRKPERTTWIEILNPRNETEHTLRMGSSTNTPRWSPDGTQLAFKTGRSLWIYTLADRGLQKVLHKEKGLGRYEWAPDGLALYFQTRGEKTSEEGEEDYERIRDPRYRLTDWDETVKLSRITRDGKVRETLTDTGEFALTASAVSSDGKRIALVRRKPLAERPFFESEFWVMDAATGALDLIKTVRFTFENGPANLTWSPGGSRLAFTAPPGETGKAGEGPEYNVFDTSLFVLDLAAGKLERLSDRFDETVAGTLTWSQQNNHIYFIAHQRAFQRICRIDPDATGGLEVLDAPPTVVTHYSLHKNGNILALLGSTIDHPVRLYKMAADTSMELKPKLVLDPNEAFMKTMRTVSWEHFNFNNTAGDPIDGWIFYPPRFDENRKWPMVVYFYGGVSPEVERFSIMYYQWMAANGYVLYVLNPSGAVGYGRAFADKHCNDWGDRAGRDIMEGVKLVLAAKSSIDPGRVGAYGGSYGGFMTLSLITECDLFRAAASMYGISNLASYWGGGIWGYTYGDTAMAGSYPWTRRDVFVDRSPLYKADKVNAALLLLHGEDDMNVPSLESEQMFTALKVLDKEVAYVRFSGEDHGIAGKFSNLKAHRRMILEWFDKHLKDQPRGWDERWK